MNRWCGTAVLAVIFLLMTVSCRQIFTTSLGESFSRDSVSISNDTSMADLVDMSNSTGSSDPAAAKEILDVLAGKDEADILALDAEDKTSVLNLATTAAIDMESLTNLAETATDENADSDQMVEDVFAAFDTSVDLTAVEVLLSDTATVETAPVETIVLASAAVLADAADVIGSDVLMDIMAQDEPDLSSLQPEQQEQIQLVLDVREILNARPDTDTDVAGFNLADLLEGNQQ